MDRQELNCFELLPYEMLMKIFQLLPVTDLVNMEKVSQLFKNVISDPQLWRKVDCEEYWFGPGEFGELLMYPIGELRISYTEIFFPIFAPGSKGEDPNFFVPLKKLTIYNEDYKIEREVLLELLNKCRPRELVLPCQIDRSLLRAIAKNVDLEVLFVDYADFFSIAAGSMFQPPPMLPGTLTTLMLNNNMSMEADDLSPSKQSMIVFRMLKNCTNLKHVGLPWMVFKREEILEFLAKQKCLESLAFYADEWLEVYSELIVWIVPKFPTIKTLRLDLRESFFRIDANNLRLISRSFTHLNGVLFPRQIKLSFDFELPN